MLRTGSKAIALATLAALSLAIVPEAVYAQSAHAAPAAPVRRASTGKRIMWTVIGTAAGFGIGAVIGFRKFDDATYSDRKITTAAILGAVAGGIVGATLSRDDARAFVPGRQPAFEPVAAAREFRLRAPDTTPRQ